MRPEKLLCLLSFFLQTAAIFCQNGNEGTASDSIYRPTGFYLFTDQDRFVDKFNEDRNYTMGVNLGVFGPVADRNYLGLPWVRKQMDKVFGLTQLHCPNQQYTAPAFSFFVSAFTPLKLDTVNPIIGDRPYASLVCFSSSYSSANEILGYAILSELNIGMLGLQLAPDAQTYIHEHHWLGSTRPTPLGWHNQISNGGEPTLMYRIGYRKRLIEQNWNAAKWPTVKRFQVVGTAEGMLGYYTNAAIGAEARFGFFSNNFWDMSTGTSLGGNQAGQPKPKTPFVEAYGFVALRERVVGYNALLQGQFRHNPYSMSAPDIERFIGEYDFGIGVRIWKINLQWNMLSGRSPEYRGQQARPHIWGGFMLRTSWTIRKKYTEKDCFIPQNTNEGEN